MEGLTNEEKYWQGWHDALEKQGEQKETLCDKCKKAQPSRSCQDITALGRCYIEGMNTSSKIESKFKVGDWIVRGDTIAQILDIQEQYYVGLDINGKDFTSSRFLNDAKIHLWSIEDAKEGDVLVASDGSLFIFAKVKDNAAYYHFSLCKNGSKEISDGNHAWETAKSCYPATKEQRDLLFSKMKEAGYKWDAEKKELKKIEQKLADKVEPKFHEGEWLCENNPNNYAHFIQILGIVNVQGDDRYRISRDIHKGEDVVEFRFVNKYYHKFNIKDAKDGDVLVTNKKQPFIFNGHYDEDTDYIYAYCGISDLVEDDSFYCDGEDVEEEFKVWCTNENVFPAIKEQRDFLFEKMHEAGYEWNEEKKELKKVEQKKDMNNKLTDFEYSLKHIIEEAIECGDTHNLKADADILIRLAQKPTTWNEEDERIYQSIMDDTVQENQLDGKQIDWLKSLKERM